MGCGRLLTVEPNSITGRIDEVISFTEIAIVILKKITDQFLFGTNIKGMAIGQGAMICATRL